MEVEWLILADAASVVGGKLNLLGGGWDVLMVNDEFPHTQHLAVAAAFRVPWIETNQPRDFSVTIISGDGDREVFKIGGAVEVGRPPGVLQGQDQRAQIVAEGIVELHEGTYSVIAEIAGGEAKQAGFRVIAGPHLARKPLG